MELTGQIQIHRRAFNLGVKKKYYRTVALIPGQYLECTK